MSGDGFLEQPDGHVTFLGISIGSLEGEVRTMGTMEPACGMAHMEGPKAGVSSINKDRRGSWLLLCLHDKMLVL